LPWNKEPHYWCDIRRFEGRYRFLDSLYVSGDREYERLYAQSCRLIDASVGYFFCIDDVIERLEMASQRPSVVFLYREPSSRAQSLFFELKKKGLESAPDLSSALARAAVRHSGLWWENYYDNVKYDDVLQKLGRTFSKVLAVDYSAFNEMTAQVIDTVATFLEIPRVAAPDLTPVNTSIDAQFATRLGRLRGLGRFLPSGPRTSLKKLLLQRAPLPKYVAPSDLLSESMNQYAALMRRVGGSRVALLSGGRVTPVLK